MFAQKSKSSMNIRIGMLALALTMALSAVANAQPTIRFRFGVTSVKLSDGFVEAVSGLGVHVDNIRPASLRRGKARFPIPGGAIDAANLRGQILHVGGLSLEAGGTRVELSEFIIDTREPGAPVLTGLAAVNGEVVDRIDLFKLVLTTPQASGRRLRIRDVQVLLTSTAADTLNAVFGVEAFVEDFEIGIAKVFAIIR